MKVFENTYREFPGKFEAQRDFFFGAKKEILNYDSYNCFVIFTLNLNLLKLENMSLNQIFSGWFVWDEIHETEKTELREFFDGSSFSRTPKIYKEYRDFIINKYREEPSRRLTFTDVRKSLVGDVSLLHKVFGFLEKWGLINFGAALGTDSSSLVVVEDEEDMSRVKIEGVVPNAVRVGGSPNSPKPLLAPPTVRHNAVGSGFNLPPLASYSDVFGDLVKPKGLVCGNCGGNCDSGHYKYTKVF